MYRHTLFSSVRPSYLLAASITLLSTGRSAFAQASMRPCPPVSERTDAPGPACFIAKQSLGELPPVPVFWHLVTYPTRDAAEAGREPNGTVVESLGKVWLFTVADAAWKPTGGVPVAKIGPLPVVRGAAYEAVYMQSIFTPGTSAPIHTHSGPEAFYTLTGETCLETPAGVQTGKGPGHVNLIPGGPPMLLMATGTEMRRSVVLILHDASLPPTTMEHTWTPRGLCKP